MTIGEYIKEKLSLWAVSLSDNMINLELSRLELSASDDISKDINLDLFFYNLIPDILSRPSSVSEGGYSISYDVKAMTTFYGVLAKRLGKTNALTTNIITDITGRW